MQGANKYSPFSSVILRASNLFLRRTFLAPLKFRLDMGWKYDQARLLDRMWKEILGQSDPDKSKRSLDYIPLVLQCHIGTPLAVSFLRKGSLPNKFHAAKLYLVAKVISN